MQETWPTGTESCFAFLRAVPILDNLDESALWQLATCGQSTIFDPGSIVMEEGDPSDAFHIVRAGQALVLKRDPGGLEQIVARLACGSYFGELGLLTNSGRSATIRVSAHAPLATYSFDPQTFHGVVADHVLLFRMQRQRRMVSRRTVTRRMGDEGFDLRQLPFLEGLSASELATLEGGAATETFAPNETLFWQHDEACRFYVVVNGSVEVEIDGEFVAELSNGDFFGETALLLDSPRTATVRSGSAGAVTWSITRRTFQQIVGHYLLRNSGSREVVLGRMPHSGEHAA